MAAGDSDWSRIAAFYSELTAGGRSSVIELNRAVAMGMAQGTDIGLSIVDRQSDEPGLKGYHMLPSVRGELRLGLAATKRRALRSKRPQRRLAMDANITC